MGCSSSSAGGVAKNEGEVLFEAVAKNDTGAVKEIIANAEGNLAVINWRHKGDGGMTPFLAGARAGSLEAVKALAASSPTAATTTDAAGNSALLHASACGKVVVMRWLVETHNADVNARNSHGDSPIFAACRDRQLEAVQYLVSLPQTDTNLCRNADAGIGGGQSPLTLCVERDDLPFVSALLAHASCAIDCADGNGDVPVEMASDALRTILLDSRTTSI